MFTVSFDLASVGKFVAVLIGAIVLFLLARAVVRLVRRVFAPHMQGFDRGLVRSRWQEIEKLASGGDLNLKMAVMEADALLDFVLKSLAMPGKTLGDRLKFAAYKFPKISRVWNAHRLRNQLAHETTAYLDPSMARRAIHDFKAALQLLNVL